MIPELTNEETLVSESIKKFPNDPFEKIAINRIICTTCFRKGNVT